MAYDSNWQHADCGWIRITYTNHTQRLHFTFSLGNMSHITFTVFVTCRDIRKKVSNISSSNSSSQEKRSRERKRKNPTTTLTERAPFGWRVLQSYFGRTLWVDSPSEQKRDICAYIITTPEGHKDDTHIQNIHTLCWAKNFPQRCTAFIMTLPKSQINLLISCLYSRIYFVSKLLSHTTAINTVNIFRSASVILSSE